MTAICGGGTSSAKPGWGASIALTVPAIAALLNNVPTTWAVPFAAYLGLVSYNLSNFCSGDPPAVPTITAADALALLTLDNPAANLAAKKKFTDLIGAYLWYQACQCDSVATPAAPTPPAAPTGLPQLNPAPLPAGPSTGPCWDRQINFRTIDTSPNFTQALMPNQGLVPTGGTTNLPTPLPSGVLLRIKSNADGTTNGAFQMSINWWSNLNENVLIRSDTITANPGQNVSARFVTPSNAITWGITAATFTTGSNNSGEAQFQIFCSGSSVTTPAAPCCPPDPTLLGQVQQILAEVQLLQRQLAPFGYIASTTHSALSGTGEISVQGLLGAKVTPSAIPSWAGRVLGDPDTLWLDSWINWGNADGWTQREFLRSSPYLSFPPLAGQFTKIGYTLADGLAVNLQELKREA